MLLRTVLSAILCSTLACTQAKPIEPDRVVVNVQTVPYR